MKIIYLVLTFAFAKLTALAIDGTRGDDATSWIERDADGFRYACGDADGNEVSCNTEPGTDECGAP